MMGQSFKPSILFISPSAFVVFAALGLSQLLAQGGKTS